MLRVWYAEILRRVSGGGEAMLPAGSAGGGEVEPGAGSGEEDGV